MKYLHVPTFIISFAIGIFFVYIYAPKYQTIYVYPNVENTNKILYKDSVGTCFKLKPNPVQCSNKKNNYPMQSFIKQF